MTFLEFVYLLWAVIASIMHVVWVVIFLVIFVKYPVRTFMKAKALGFDPLPNRRMKIVALSDDNELAKTSDNSFVFTNPDHFFTETKTRKPCVIMDSRLGRTISIDAVRLMNALKDAGIGNYDQLKAAYEQDPEAKIQLDGGKAVEVRKEMFKDFEVDAKAGAVVDVDGFPVTLDTDMIEDIRKNGAAEIRIIGASLKVSDAVDYFSQSIPGTVMETMLQYRSAVENLRSKKRDLMQWLIVGAVCAMFFAFAVLLVSYAAPPVSNVVAGAAGTAGTSVK